MKRKRIFKVVLWVIIICISVFGAFAAIVYIPELKHWLPTHSKAGELRVASYGGSVRGVSITLNYSDGRSYIMNINDAIDVGQPQNYSFPADMPNEFVTVHITLDSSYHLGEWDMDVMAFDPRENNLKRDGLLVYFKEGRSIYIISGNYKACYVYTDIYNDMHNNILDDSWVLLANPLPISHFPDGLGGNPDWISYGWHENEWEYRPSPEASVP